MALRRLTSAFAEPTPKPFDFVATVHAHGWVRLRPFEWNARTAELRRVHRLQSGHVVRLRLRDGGTVDASCVAIKVEHVHPLSVYDITEIRAGVRRMLRLDEELSEFFQLYQQLQGWSLQLQPGAGRLLRCPTLFEDMVYTLCTTNTAWTGTIRMVDRLVTTLGEPFPGRHEWRAFPTPEAVAVAGEGLLVEEVRLGYRSHYLWRLAAEVVAGHLNLQALEDPELSLRDLRRTLLGIKGVGSYAAATVQMILGRYEELAIDTAVRAFVAKKYFAGQHVSEAHIRAVYAPWGRWQYLAYWFDT
jgi:3-methyladenine DNA glycosylase/8-oxoguanine DNA glycosylase